MTRKQNLIIGTVLTAIGMATAPYIFPVNLIMCAAGGWYLGKAFWDV